MMVRSSDASGRSSGGSVNFSMATDFREHVLQARYALGFRSTLPTSLGTQYGRFDVGCCRTPTALAPTPEAADEHRVRCFRHHEVRSARQVVPVKAEHVSQAVNDAPRSRDSRPMTFALMALYYSAERRLAPPVVDHPTQDGRVAARAGTKPIVLRRPPPCALSRA